MTTPLAGIRVIDLSRVLAGPWSAQVLADLGAEVIKVERIGCGDDTRGWGPPYARPENDQHANEAAYFLSANRGKQSIAVDLKSDRGQQIVRDLVAQSDILIENFKAGDLSRYGLDYGSLATINPRLIYCSITGFGQSGPYSQLAGYDFMIQGMAGLMSITGNPDDAPGGGPLKVGVALTDVLTGLYATIGILSAVAQREKTGQGQKVDLALFEVMVACLANQSMNYLLSGSSPQRMGNSHPNIVPYQAFAVADGHFLLAVGNDGQFSRLCRELGLADIGNDARFETNSGRVDCREELVAQLQEAFLYYSREELLDRLQAVNVPCGPINSLDQVFSDPHLVYRKVVQQIPHETLGVVPSVSNPIRFSDRIVSSGKAAPVLGEHTWEILSGLLNRTDAQIIADLDAGVIGVHAGKVGA